MASISTDKQSGIWWAGCERRRLWSAQGLFKSYLPRFPGHPPSPVPCRRGCCIFLSFPATPHFHLHIRYQQTSQSSSSILVFYATCSVRPFTATASWWCCQGLSASLSAFSSIHFKALSILAQNGLIEIPRAFRNIQKENKDNRFVKFGIPILALLGSVLHFGNRPFVFIHRGISSS
jgi:hypothetical protein